jgi:peroxiredoxin
MTHGVAPEFDLVTLDGERKSLAGLLASGPVLLAFYKVTCPTCQLTFPFLQRLHAGAGPGSPQVIAVSQDDAAATAQFNRRFGITFTTLLDGREERYPASNAYGITNVPTLFLVEQDGRVSQSVAGFEKAEMLKLGERFGVQVFDSGERVPVFQPG